MDDNATDITNLNPFRYRSYYLDTGLNLYYLKTRCYDPEICRFITIDDISYLAPDTINGLNLYAYCFNNPIVFCDINGTDPLVIAGVGFLGFALLALGVAMVGAMTQTAPETSITLPNLETVMLPLYMFSALIGMVGAKEETEEVTTNPEPTYNYWKAEIINDVVTPLEPLTYSEARAWVAAENNLLCVDHAAAIAIVKFYPSAVWDSAHGGGISCGYLHHYHLSSAHSNHIWYYGE